MTQCVGERQPPLLLAGDIGGTKTTLALYDLSSRSESALAKQTYLNSTFKTFEELVGQFLASMNSLVSTCCLGVAGPVFDNTVHMTNLDWTISAENLQQHFKWRRVDLINDLTATGLGAIHLPQSDLRCLNNGTLNPTGVVAVLAPGTGLGEAFLLPYNGNYIPVPSEGGHADFSPRNREQIDLLEFMLERQDHVSVEQVCSGRALPDLFLFMQTKYSTPPWLLEQLDTCPDPTPVLIKAALSGEANGQHCEIAVQTVKLFVDILAAEAANLTLKTLCFGGLYLAGGLIARLQSFLRPQRFMSLFVRGVHRHMLENIPIHIVLNPETALLGAAKYGFGNVVIPSDLPPSTPFDQQATTN